MTGTKVHHLRAFVLPNGATVEVEVHEGDVNAHDGDDRNWKAVDVTLTHPNGDIEVLCTVDYEDDRGVRTNVYEYESADPIYVREPVIREVME